MHRISLLTLAALAAVSANAGAAGITPGNIAPLAVPEPANLALMLSGVALLGAFATRRRA